MRRRRLQAFNYVPGFQYSCRIYLYITVVNPQYYHTVLYQASKAIYASRNLPLQLLSLQQLLPNLTLAFQNLPWSHSLFLWLGQCTHQSPKGKTYLNFRRLFIREQSYPTVLFFPSVKAEDLFKKIFNGIHLGIQMFCSLLLPHLKIGLYMVKQEDKVDHFVQLRIIATSSLQRVSLTCWTEVFQEVTCISRNNII